MRRVRVALTFVALLGLILSACRGSGASSAGVGSSTVVRDVGVTPSARRESDLAPASPSPASSSRPTLASAEPDASASAASPANPRVADAGGVSFLALGDMILTRNVGRAIAATGDPRWPFRGMSGLLDGVDFAFANLEAPLPAEEGLAPELLRIVQRRGFAVLSLANNHAMDGGREGLTRTVELLRRAGIATAGVGSNSEEAWRPALIRRGGITIAFLAASYTSVNGGRAAWRSEIARIQDVITARQAIVAADAEADFVVAAMHAGTEYVRHPVEEQRRFAHLAVDAGADMVIGTHPHVVQPAERYRGVWIFYSLGNFLFDQARPAEVKQSAAVRATLVRRDGAGVSLARLEVIPLTNGDMVSPEPAAEASAAKTLRRMGLADAVLIP